MSGIFATGRIIVIISGSAQTEIIRTGSMKLLVMARDFSIQWKYKSETTIPAMPHAIKKRTKYFLGVIGQNHGRKSIKWRMDCGSTWLNIVSFMRVKNPLGLRFGLGRSSGREFSANFSYTTP